MNSTNCIRHLNKITVLPTLTELGYIAHVVAKSTAERQNSNNKHKVNISTPNNRAFFVRSIRTPKENNLLKCKQVAFLSMVERIGKGSPFAVFLVLQFLTPIRSTAQIVRNLAVVFKHTQGLSSMIYTYLCADRSADTYTENRIRIHADSEQNARFQLDARYRLVLPRPIARMAQGHFAKNPQNPTGCNAKGGLYA